MVEALAIGADTSQGAPGDALEYTASAGGAAYIIGEKNTLADIEHTCSYTTDTPDFYRREGEDYPSHGGRFTGEPAYFKHVLGAAKMLFEETDSKPEAPETAQPRLLLQDCQQRNLRPSRISERWEICLKIPPFPRSRNCGRMEETEQ